MDAFVSRKKRKLSSSQVATQATTPDPSTGPPENSLSLTHDEESTDFKLALLSSLHSITDQQLLLDILLAHGGSVEEASASLTTPNSPPRKSTSSTATGYQSSLSNFVGQDDPGDGSKRAKLLSKSGKTLHLYDPADVAKHTPCSIIHNFLPLEEANALLAELLEEAPTFERMSFKLFDNVVQSPHTACFYVESFEEMQRQKTEYIYNGGKLTDIRQLTPQMRSVSPKVQVAVNTQIQERINTYPNGKKLKHQSPHPWKPNAAFVNCYNGPAESVGYHSDQLTYLGPHAVIGSISLGVAREFRVRRIVPQDDEDTSPDSQPKNAAKSKSIGGSKEPSASDLQGQIAIHLPHNSLLIMHAEMQEEWKHSIAPAPTIIPHPIAGNKRINITYREYKKSLHPKFTPRCYCGVPAVLRVVQRKRENWGRYFWMCYAGNVPDKAKEGCKWFEWAVFDEDGEPVWKRGKGSGSAWTVDGGEEKIEDVEGGKK